jgi:hypothetical protein
MGGERWPCPRIIDFSAEFLTALPSYWDVFETTVVSYRFCVPAVSRWLPISWRTLLLNRLDHHPREDMVDERERGAKLVTGEDAGFSQVGG